jgi:2-oxoisovalerate dehydrogenase E1 component
MKKTVKYDTKRLSKKKQIELYLALLKPRLIEEKMLILLRQGKISKWFAGIGQEAISVGCTMALESDEKIFPMHRNLGVFTTREVPMKRLFCQWQGKLEGFTKGRDRSFHFGAPDYNIVGMISHLGPQLSLAGGVALSHKLNKRNKIALAFTGEGGTSQGEFHEALNVAAVWKLPVIFVIENNGYGLSTPTNEQYACENLADRAIGYGMKTEIVDGNNVVEMYETIDRIAKKIRKSPEPYLIECKTFRMRGHEEASGTKYVPKELMEMWAKKDPLSNFEKHLIKNGVINKDEVDQWTKSIKEEINAELEASYAEPPISSSLTSEMEDLFAPHTQNIEAPSTEVTEMRYIDAITSGLQESMRTHDNLVLMGQDIADYGGVFKVTDGFVAEFGKERVRNTPLCESAIVGAALGLTMEGDKAMMEMQFADFVSCGFNQIVNNLAKIHYRWGHKADVVVRMPTGGGLGAGPFHSQSNEAWFTKTPGLKVVYPSNPHDAKGLLIAAINDPNPVMFFEHKGLYRLEIGEVPNGSYEVEIGKAKLISEGDSLSIITYGLGVHWAKKYKEESNIDIDIIDLVSLCPIDYKTIEESVKKTNRVIILHEDTMFGGIAGDISAYISEHLFEHLDAPVCRVASLDIPVPFDKGLEKIFLPIDRLKEKVETLLAY